MLGRLRCGVDRLGATSSAPAEIAAAFRLRCGVARPAASVQARTKAPNTVSLLVRPCVCVCADECAVAAWRPREDDDRRRWLSGVRPGHGGIVNRGSDATSAHASVSECARGSGQDATGVMDDDVESSVSPGCGKLQSIRAVGGGCVRATDAPGGALRCVRGPRRFRAGPGVGRRLCAATHARDASVR